MRLGVDRVVRQIDGARQKDGETVEQTVDTLRTFFWKIDKRVVSAYFEKQMG